MLVYLAGPMDYHQANNDLRDRVALELGGQGIAYFDPTSAYGAADNDARQVFDINEHVIASCDGLLAVWPDNVQSIGTPMEILSAHRQGKPVVVIGCVRSMQLRALGIPAYPFDFFVQAIKDLKDRVEKGRPVRRGEYVRGQVLLSDFADVTKYHDAAAFPPIRINPATELGEAWLEATRIPTIRWTGDEQHEPYRPYEGDAGFDLICSDRVTIEPGRFADVACGINVEFPRNTWGMITGRSSTLRRRGLLVHQGIIDNGYRGPLFAGVFNLSEQPRTIRPGDRVAQIIPFPLTAKGLTFEHVAVLTEADRGQAGFGSTGDRVLKAVD